MSEPKMLRVGKYTTECPQYWLNFLNSINPPGVDAWTSINLALMPYRARYYSESVRNAIVVFDREEDAVLFALMWS